MRAPGTQTARGRNDNIVQQCVERSTHKQQIEKAVGSRAYNTGTGEAPLLMQHRNVFKTMPTESKPHPISKSQSMSERNQLCEHVDVKQSGGEQSLNYLFYNSPDSKLNP